MATGVAGTKFTSYIYPRAIWLANQGCFQPRPRATYSKSWLLSGIWQLSDAADKFCCHVKHNISFNMSLAYYWYLLMYMSLSTCLKRLYIKILGTKTANTVTVSEEIVSPYSFAFYTKTTLTEYVEMHFVSFLFT